MTLRRVRVSRTQLVGVLTRPPSSGAEPQAFCAMVVDPFEQIRELADLRDRGLLSDGEFERQKAKVLQR